MKKQLQEWGTVFLWATVIIIGLFFCCWPVRLLGSSMEPTMSNGDIVLFHRISTLCGKYKKGDIVLFDAFIGEEKTTVVKRIIATEGDVISIQENGVEVNGIVLEEEYIMGETIGFVDMTVPKDTVFVLGDNRQTSIDSRNMGPISCEQLKGKVFFRIFPFVKFGNV